MIRAINKTISIIAAVILSVLCFDVGQTVTALLITCFLCAVGEITELRYFHVAAFALLLFVGLFFPPAVIFACALIQGFKKLDFFATAFLLPAAVLLNFPAGLVCLAVECIFSVCLVVEGTVTAERYKEMKIARDVYDEERRRQEKTCRTLSERIETEKELAALKERNRISAELHDRIGHTVTGALLATGALIVTVEDPEEKEKLIAIKNTLSSGMDDIRKSLRGFHEEIVDIETELSNILSSFTGFETSLSVSLSSIVRRDYALALTDTLKEALSNAAKHSGGNAVAVELKEFPGFYRFTVKDNGKGGNPKDGVGLGLAGMAERAKSLGGYFTADGNDGFKITLTLFKKCKNYV